MRKILLYAGIVLVNSGMIFWGAGGFL